MCLLPIAYIPYHAYGKCLLAYTVDESGWKPAPCPPRKRLVGLAG